MVGEHISISERSMLTSDEILEIREALIKEIEKRQARIRTECIPAFKMTDPRVPFYISQQFLDLHNTLGLLLAKIEKEKSLITGLVTRPKEYVPIFIETNAHIAQSLNDAVKKEVRLFELLVHNGDRKDAAYWQDLAAAARGDNVK